MMNSISCREIVKIIVKKQKIKYNSFTKDGIDFKNKLSDKEFNDFDVALNKRGMSLFITIDMHSSIYKLITDIRVEIAIELIKEGKLKLNEISFYLQYYDYSHFSRQFSKETGHNPGFFKISKK